MHAPLPANCHDVKTAAEILGTNVFNLYKQLRKMAWVHTGASKKDPLRNTPKAWAKQQGLLIGQERGFAAPYNNQLTKIYITTLITERGLQKLVTLMDKNNTQHPTHTTQTHGAKRTKRDTCQAKKPRCRNQQGVRGINGNDG